MNRKEFLKYCETLSREQLHEIAAKDRAGGHPLPPEIAELFHSLDNVTEAVELYVQTAGSPAPQGTHLFVVKPLDPLAGRMPVVVNVHGGGWCKPHSNRDLYFSRRLAHKLGCLVVDVDYVLAPEYPYPAALEELEGLFRELPPLLDSHGGDPERVMLCGQSSGGNLLAGVCHRKRYGRAVNIRGQILCYPPCDNYHSHFGADEELDPRGMQTEYYGFYYNPRMEDRKNPDVSLNFAGPTELQDLPSTDVITAGQDNLCPEGKRYFDLLRAHSVKSTYRCFEESRHGFVINLMDQWKEAEAYILERMQAYFS